MFFVFFFSFIAFLVQSPGCTLTVDEKLTIARQLSRLGVDICEAGFPIASEGDFEAVKKIAKDVGLGFAGKFSEHGSEQVEGKPPAPFIWRNAPYNISLLKHYFPFPK